MWYTECMKQTSAKVCSILLSLVLALFAVSASVAVPTLWRGFYYLHIDALELSAQTGYSEDVIREAALAAVSNALDGKEPRKVIVVKGRLVNIVAK